MKFFKDIFNIKMVVNKRICIIFLKNEVSTRVHSLADRSTVLIRQLSLLFTIDVWNRLGMFKRTVLYTVTINLC